MILRILWLACYNFEIDWRTGEVKMTMCSEECGKKWRPKQEKLCSGKNKRKRRRSRKQEENEKRKKREKGRPLMI